MNTYTNMKLISMSLLMGLFYVSVAPAAPILSEYQDGSAFPFASWDSEDADDATDYSGSISMNDGGVGNPTPGLAINASTVDAAVPVSALVFTTDAALIGNLSTYAGMAFDFYASANNNGTGAPISLQFYFQGNGETWFYNIGTAYINDGWDTYNVAFGYGVNAYGSSSWYATGGDNDAAAFSTALAGVTRIGIEITYFDNLTAPNQQYGIDDFGLTVPEPETYMALGMALLGMAFVFRKRITESLADARAMMQM